MGSISNRSLHEIQEALSVHRFPQWDNLSTVMAADLLGNGTACLVWSSPLAHDARVPMRYIDLMGGNKPHLLVRCVNNLGAETILADWRQAVVGLNVHFGW